MAELRDQMQRRASQMRAALGIDPQTEVSVTEDVEPRCTCRWDHNACRADDCDCPVCRDAP